MSDFYIDYINGKPHQVYYLDSPRLLVFDYRKITENEAHIHWTLKNAKFTDDAKAELYRRIWLGMHKDISQMHHNCRCVIKPIRKNTQ